MIRVLHYMKELDYGGIESFVFNHYKYIDKKFFHFDFLIETDSQGVYEKEIKEWNIKKYIVDISGKRNYLEIYRKYYTFFKKNKDMFDVVHFEAVGPNACSVCIIYAAKRAGIKARIIHSHMAMNKSELSLIRRIKIVLFRYILSSIGTCYIACSKAADEFAYSKKRREKGVYIFNNAIDIKNYKYSMSARQKIREELFVDEKTLLLGNVGRILRRKNQIFMVKVMEELLKREKRIKLLIVGAPSTGDQVYMNELQKYIREKGLQDKVIFTGNRTDIPQILSAMDIFLFPSENEGLGIVGIEAQASGIPILASEKISKEMDVSQTVIWMEKQSMPSEWADVIENIALGRKDNSICLMQAGYDIKDNVYKLEDIYINECKG